MMSRATACCFSIRIKSGTGALDRLRVLAAAQRVARASALEAPFFRRPTLRRDFEISTPVRSAITRRGLGRVPFAPLTTGSAKTSSATRNAAGLFRREEYFRFELPIDRSSMSRWRDRIGPDGLEKVFQESLGVAHRTVRDIRRKTADDEGLQDTFRRPLWLAQRVLTQKRRDPHPKVHARHAPEVECIGKGKARKPYEFGCKSLPRARPGVSIASTNNRAPGGQFVTHVKAFHGNPGACPRA